MIPIVNISRLTSASGLWTTKLSGEFTAGDPNTTKFYVEGSVEIKELGGHLRIYFKGIQLKARKMTSSSNNSENKENEEEDSSDSDDEDEDGQKKQSTTNDTEDIGPIPKLEVYLSGKKPKKRMVDAHSSGVKLKIDGVKDGIFGDDKEPKDYVANIIDIVDVLAFKGLMVLKVPEEEPFTAEPVIYGYIRLKSFQKAMPRTVDALHLSEMSDMLSKLTQQDTVLTHTLNNQSKKLLKPLRTYSELANKAFVAFNKDPNTDTVTFPEIMRMLDYLNLFFLTVQAQRIFDSINQKKHAVSIDVAEFENFLIAKDLLHPYSKQILPMDVFDALKSDPIDLNELIVTVKPEEVKDTSTNNNLKDVINGDNNSNSNNANGEVKPEESTTAVVAATEEAADKDKNKNTTSAEEVQLYRDMKATLAAQEKKKKAAASKPQGMSYSGFLEAIEILGYRENKDDTDEDETEMIQKGYCFGTGKSFKEAMKQIDELSLSLHEFYKSWLKIAKLDQEMLRYGIKYEFGLFAEDRNRERILSRVKEQEQIYLSNLKIVNLFIQDMKAEYRNTKDAKRKAKKAYEEQLLHETNKFIAKRAQEKRLLLKLEQEEKNKKRLEEKLIKQKLLLRKAEQERLARIKIMENNETAMKLHKEEIRLLGYDYVNYSNQQLKEIPFHLYSTIDAQKKLNYAKYIDLSSNQIQYIPPYTKQFNGNHGNHGKGIKESFFYHLLDCEELNLSNNHLQSTSLSQEIQYLQNLKILYLQNNGLQSLPLTLQTLSNLQRLDISNNLLTGGILQDDLFRDLHLLKYCNLHSNHITSLPSSLGNCYQLEYLNISNNQLIELPESLENCIHLIHMDISHNQITYLPHQIGLCQSLAYLDISTNRITVLPTSFNKLVGLEYVNFQYNEVINLHGNCNELSNVKEMIGNYNRIHSITNDVGNMQHIIHLTLSHNTMSSLPIEIGLLSHLQVLDVSYNHLMTIPMELGSCISLQTLTLSHNEITGCLPETMGLIYSLVELDISYNNINALPKSIVGYQELVLLQASHCQLSQFPETIIQLPKLQTIDVSNNKFIIFPIELHCMKSLKTLNLYNNIISLLPRNIDSMYRLELNELNLAKNQLLALPMEFISLLESIPSLPLEDNPWTLLPPKWGTIQAGKLTPEAYQGYTLHDCLDFLYAVRIFYNTAEQLWLEYGVFYMTNRMGWDDFLQELQDRLPKTWHDGLLEYAKHLYFKCREMGAFVKYYLLDAQTEADHAKKAAYIERRKDYQVIKSKNDLLQREKMSEIAYGINRPEILQRLVKRTVNRVAEQARNEEYLHTQSMHALHDIVVKHDQKANTRLHKRNELFALRKDQEVHRLQDIIKLDQKQYVEEKRMMKEMEEFTNKVLEEKQQQQKTIRKKV